MGMWAIMASPLLMSVDLRTIKKESKMLLQNPHVIAINQDPRGKQGTRMKKDKQTEVWIKPLSRNCSIALAILNLRDDGKPSRISINVSKMFSGMLGGTIAHEVMEVFDNQSMGIFNATSNFVTLVNPTGIFLGTVHSL